MLPTWARVAGETDDPREGLPLLPAVHGRVVRLHLLGEVPRDRAGHEVVHLGGAGEIVERSP